MGGGKEHATPRRSRGRRAPTRQLNTYSLFPIHRVFICGSVTPGEASSDNSSRRYQFVQAAMHRGPDVNTLALVEQTGHDRNGLDRVKVEEDLAPARVLWFGSEVALLRELNVLPDGEIRELLIFAHGIPAEINFCYGHGGHSYAWRIESISGLRREIYSERARIEIHSCNAGTSDDARGIWAQDLSTHLRRPVKAWTGRTSYRAVNDPNDGGDTSIHPSVPMPRGFLPALRTPGDAIREAWNTYIAFRDPEFVEFRPSYDVVVDLPTPMEIPQAFSTPFYFPVPNRGVVMLSTETPANVSPSERFNVGLLLHRFEHDRVIPGPRVVDGSLRRLDILRACPTWPTLKGGWYLLKIMVYQRALPRHQTRLKVT